MTHGRPDGAIPGPFETFNTWPCLGLLNTIYRYQADESRREAAFLEAQNTVWTTAALNRIMPEEYPGQHTLAARDINSNWNSQKGMMIRLFLLSNNFSLSDEYFPNKIHDAQISAVVEHIISTGSQSLQCFLSAQGLVSEAIKAEVFSWALRCGRDDIVRLFLRLGQSPDLDSTYASRWGSQPLQVAAFISDKRTSVKMIHALLEHGAKIDSSLVHSALNIAIAKDNQEAVKVLVKAGACLRLPSLAAAIWSGNDEIVRKVLDTGVDVNEKILPPPALWDMNRWAALAHAAHRGQLQIVKTLVARGADVDAVHAWSEFRGVWYEKLRTTALGIAAAAEQVETVRFLAGITSGGTREESAGDHIWPLAIAALTGNNEIIRVLLTAGADVSRADEIPERLGWRVEHNSECLWWCFPKTLLECLIIQLKGDEETLVELCETLINKGARTDRALVIATIKERVEVVRLLPRHGTTLDIPPETMHGSSAFGLAIEMGNFTLVRMLHDVGATETGIIRNIKGEETAEFLDSVGLLGVVLRKHGWAILDKAIEGGEESRWLVARILETEMDLTGKYVSIMATAVKHRLDINFIKTMISHGAAWTTWNILEAIEAALKADASGDITHLLLGAWKTAKKTPCGFEGNILILLRAAGRGSRQILDIILAAFDWTPKDLGVALNRSIFHSNYRVIQDLLDAGAALEGDPWNGSPLQAAIKQEQMWLVKVLLEAGADVQDDEALLSAVHRGNMGLVELLLTKGANPDNPLAPTKKILTALQLASSMGFLAIVRTLTDAGADINAPGWAVDDPSSDSYALKLTALTVAALEGRLEILHLLLSRGAAVHGAARGQYIDAVRAAKLRRHGAAAALLKSYGGWTEEDERVCRTEHAVAVAAMKAHYEKISSDESSSEKGTDDIGTTHSAVQGWPHSMENEWGIGLADTHTEFDDFFLTELGRFQDYSMDSNGWLSSF